jgi:hypothetical protein
MTFLVPLNPRILMFQVKASQTINQMSVDRRLVLTGQSMVGRIGCVYNFRPWICPTKVNLKNYKQYFDSAMSLSTAT